MSQPEAGNDLLDLGGFRLEVSTPELRRVTFERPEQPGEVGETSFRLGLGARRTADDAVAIEVTAETDEFSLVQFQVAYRALLTVRPTEAAPRDFDMAAVLGGIASSIGPVLVYPYIRETLSTLSAKAGLPGIMLPVMNVGAMFDPIGLEPASDDEDVSSPSTGG